MSEEIAKETPDKNEDQTKPKGAEGQQLTTEQPSGEDAINKQEELVPAAAKIPDDGTPVVLVTGASGFIATYVIKQLLQEGKYRVRGTVRDSKNEAKVRPLMELVPDAARPLELVDADLLNDESWKEAVRGCTFVLHLASPFPSKQPKNEDEVIRPAVEGTLSVLRACSEAGTVKRVVFVSSIAAVSAGLNGESGKIHTEEDWSAEEACTPYEKSKLKAEKAALDFMKNLEEKKFDLITVCPAVVIGPVLTTSSANNTSVEMVTNLIANKLPSIPNISLPLVDVRDVAPAIIVAMEKNELANNRYLLANETPLHYVEAGIMVRSEFKPQGYKVPSKPIGKVGMWIFSKIDARGKIAKSIEGKEMKYNISKAMADLCLAPRPVKSTVLDTCYSLIDIGAVKKTPGYLGHPDNRPPPPEEPKGEETPAEEPKAEETPAEEPKAKETPPEEPKAEETPVEEPKAEEPKAEETPVEEPKAEEPKAEEPKAEETLVEEPKAEEPKAEETPVEEPKAEELKAEEPKAEEPKAEEPKAEETPVEEPKAEEPKAEETPAEETKAEEIPVEEPKAEEPKAEEPKPEEPKAEETPVEEPKAEEPKAEEPKAEELKAEEPKAEEPKAEEPKAEETPVEEPKAEEPKAEETPAEETKAEEIPVEEPKAEEPKAEEPKPEEPKAEETPVEEPKAEEPKAEEPKAEELKAEEPKAEETPVEEPKAEETKAEELKAEETPAEEPNIEETPAEEPKVEETPVEEPKVEDTPAEEKVEETPMEEPKVEEHKDEEPTAEETPVETEPPSDLPADGEES